MKRITKHARINWKHFSDSAAERVEKSYPFLPEIEINLNQLLLDTQHRKTKRKSIEKW